MRPQYIVISLYADGVFVESKEVTEGDDGKWSWSWTGLDKYDEDGEEIEYTVTEELVPEYTTEPGPGTYDFTNHHMPKVSVEGEKFWDDFNDEDGVRPDHIIINLLANGEFFDTKTVIEGEDGRWTWSWTGLDKYDEDGEEIEYTVTEELVPEYTTEPGPGTYDFTNHHMPKVDVEGEKTWDDFSNEDGVRPDYIIIKLYANGELVESKNVTEGEDGKWSWSWTGLDKYDADGNEIEYTVTEDPVADYTTDQDGYNFTNHHMPKVDVEGEKTWDDFSNEDGVRPQYIVISLYAGGEFVESKEVTEGDDGKWSWSWTGLDKYDADGNEIEYTVTEDPVADYTTDQDGYNFTNHHMPKVDVEGEKTWDDHDDADGIRPDHVVIRLYAGGEEIDSKTVTKDDDWKWSWTGLDKYDAEGNVIEYTLTEDAVAGYTSKRDGYNFINTHNSLTELTVVKIWNDFDDEEGVRPVSITVELRVGEETLEEIVLSEENGWTHTWEGLDRFDADGNEIEYEVYEDPDQFEKNEKGEPIYSADYDYDTEAYVCISPTRTPGTATSTT